MLNENGHVCNICFCVIKIQVSKEVVYFEGVPIMIKMYLVSQQCHAQPRPRWLCTCTRHSGSNTNHLIPRTSSQGSCKVEILQQQSLDSGSQDSRGEPCVCVVKVAPPSPHINRSCSELQSMLRPTRRTSLDLSEPVSIPSARYTQYTQLPDPAVRQSIQWPRAETLPLLLRHLDNPGPPPSLEYDLTFT